MPIQGLRHTGNFESNQRPQNWREAILRLMPNGKAPLTALTSLMKTEATNDPQFNWFDKALPQQRVQLSGSITDSATTIGISSGGLGLKKNHLLRSEQTGEIMFVSADPSVDNSITVTRGFASSTAAAVTLGAGINPFLHVIGTAHEEASLPPSGINYDPTKHQNYTQIFRNTLEMSRTASKTRLRTGDQVKEAKRETLELHSMELEMAFWFGKPHETTSGGKPLRTTGGLLHFIHSDNIVTNTDGSFTMDELEEWLLRMFKYGSSEKIGFCGNTVVKAVNQCVRKNSSFQIVSGIKEFGMNVTRLSCPFGELVLKTHPLWNHLAAPTGADYLGLDSWLAVIDAENVVYRPFQGDDMRYEKQLQQNGLDGMQSGYITECGIEVHHPLTHFLIKGLKTGLSDS